MYVQDVVKNFLENINKRFPSDIQEKVAKLPKVRN